MNIQQLIDALQKVQDKTQKVEFYITPHQLNDLAERVGKRDTFTDAYGIEQDNYIPVSVEHQLDGTVYLVTGE